MYCGRLTELRSFRNSCGFAGTSAFVGSGYLNGALSLIKAVSNRSTFAPNVGFVVLTAWALNSFSPEFRKPKVS